MEIERDLKNSVRAGKLSRRSSSAQQRRTWTIRDVLAWTTGYFQEKGIPSPRLDAEVLLAHALAADRLYLYVNLDRPLSPEERQKLRECVARRAAREPVALITGVKEFWSIPFKVAPGILIPRPDTEILVEAVLDEIKDVASPQVLEIGTGSGAIAVSVAKDKPQARVLAVDINPIALQTAESNAEAAGVSQSVELAASDLFQGLAPDRRFHVICSNPPYVPTGEIARLEPEIRQYEPLQALDGGDDGLDVIRQIAAGAKNHLLPGGALILEFGDGQANAVKEILSREGGLGEIQITEDLAGIPRVAKGKA